MKIKELPIAPEGITPLQAIAVLEGIISKYTIQNIRNEIFRKENETAKLNLEETHGKYSWWSTRDDEPILKIKKSFESRAEALAYLKRHCLEKPEFKKTSFATSERFAKTLCSLTCTGEIDGVGYEVEANYTRDGLPTKKCRVVPIVSYSVACHL